MSTLPSKTLRIDLAALSPPRINAGSVLSYICGAFIVFLVCAPTLHRKITTPPGFGLYWASGAAIARGSNPYAVFPETFTSHLQIMGKEQVVVDLNLNPPCVLPFLQALSHLSPERWNVTWTVGSFLLLLGTVALLMWRRPDIQKRQILWLLLAAPVFDTLLGTQLYFVLFLFAALALVFLDSDHAGAAAIAIGLVVAIKPTTAFWPLFLYLAGYRKLALRSCGVTLVASAAPLLLYGPSVYREWFSAIAKDPHWIFPGNIALPAVFARLGLPSLGFALAVILAALLTVAVWKTKPEFTTVSGIALCAAILCAPFAWVDYALLVAPYFVSRRWSLPSNLAAALLTVPGAVIVVMSRPAGRLWVTLGSGIYVAAVSIILASFASHGFRRLKKPTT